MNALKQSFNLVASSYEKYRPLYPDQLYKDIFTYTDLQPSAKLLEIGCGTGKATGGFIEQGFSNITCIEYGKNLAKFTQEKFAANPNIRIIHTSFEDWHSDDQYDLAFSGTAFHFIPAETGYPKTASLLKKEAVSAFFWFTHIASDESVYQSIRTVYQEHAPHLNDSLIPNKEDFIKERSALTLESDHFHQLLVKTYTWEQIYTPHDYIGLLNTHSEHQILPQEQKGFLFSGIERAILKHGKSITKKHAVVLFLARKK
ncbi:class I SAM-dependent methyltransferase [Fictibacillus phosphorivorans]|uniref:class I SAM-dependent methyltransferase n=1 Tax=Fictibacillus phosphorivorans TaxID=1221500 RepID=UPI00203EE8E9|nr:class I SAM-dependent methyltransferase [Fictibacillus phosphorivorans]MCM3717345.1 class I SAM-dependent methyltransferase [Fictibacillus phosphorivorans]MCM3775040.1 class I SAM-dependent methyltransferase [Fictibacillus phosphorivorans]